VDLFEPLNDMNKSEIIFYPGYIFGCNSVVVYFETAFFDYIFGQKTPYIYNFV
jgi:hypothetical protein